MVDREHDARYNNRVKRLLKNFSLPLIHASVSDIQYLPERHLDQDQINRLSTNEFVIPKRNILLMGATGAGKTFLTNAIAVDTCWAGYNVSYVRLPDFFIGYANGTAEHKEFDSLIQYRKSSLLVLDEFLLLLADDTQQRILLELLERRFVNVSTIFCSQTTRKAGMTSSTALPSQNPSSIASLLTLIKSLSKEMSLCDSPLALMIKEHS